MLQALEKPLNRSAEARVKTVPVPLKGWNTRDRYAENRDSILYAPVLTNFFVNEGKLEMVAGYDEHSTGLPMADVESLMEYDAEGATKLFAAVGSEIYDCTSHGAVGGADLSGKTNARWQHTMYATTSGQYLCTVNGADGFWTYNGSAWIERSITGVSSSDLINISSHKTRLWFVQKNTMKAWYLPTLAISGTATSIDFGSLCKHGGTLVATATWTYDGGSGVDDLFVALTSQGEVLIYQGTDPASDWSLVGVFKIDKPIGLRCVEKFGSDLAVLTESGVVQMSQVLQSITGRDAFSDAIRDEFVKAASSAARDIFGWELQLYSKRGWLVCNIPQIDGTYDQFIFNTVSPGWFKMTGKNAVCWHATGDNLHFGGADGGLYHADNGESDNGAAIVGEYQPAWSRFGTSQKKQFTLVRPNFLSDGAPTPYCSMKVEYEDSDPGQLPEISFGISGSEWDEDEWDVAVWGGGIFPTSRWVTVSGIGIVGAPRIKVSSATVFVSIVSVDVAFEIGGIV